jgi:GDP-L-fucose synthase
MAAAMVGGILANQTLPAECMRASLDIHTAIIHAAHKHGVRRPLFLGSCCIYPKHAAQPLRENSLLTGPLEPPHRPYAGQDRRHRVVLKRQPPVRHPLPGGHADPPVRAR